MKTGAASGASLPCLCPTRLHSSTASSAPRHMPMTCRVSWRAATSWYFCVTASSQSSMRTDSRSSGEAPCPGKVRLYVWMPARFRTLCIEPRSYSVPPNPWIRRAPVPDGASGLLDGIGGLALDLAQPPHAGDDGHAAVEVRQRRAPVADQPPAACRVRHAEQQGRAVLGARAAGCPVHRQARPVFRMRMGGQGFQIGDGAGGQAEGVLQVARQFQFAVIGIEAVHQLVAAGQRQVEAAAPLFRVLKRLGARAAQGVDAQPQQGRDDQVDLGGQHDAVAAGAVVVVRGDQQRVLPAGHGQPDFGQQLRVKQCAVQRAMSIGNAEAVAQRVQRIALAREQRPRVQQRIGDRLAVFGDRAAARLGQFGVEELHVERGVVRDQFGALDDFDELVRHIGEAGLVRQELRRQPVHRQGLGVAVAVRVQVDVQVIARGHPIDHFHAADLDDAMPLGGVKSGGFRVKDDLAHNLFRRWVGRSRRRVRARRVGRGMLCAAGMAGFLARGGNQRIGHRHDEQGQ
ncbi:hypothetical protein G6F57_015039 [Rhizopus arrhizus]|nr:hypothetical protein G6F57_015039 [Rhizopus arrhizus]